MTTTCYCWGVPIPRVLVQSLWPSSHIVCTASEILFLTLFNRSDSCHHRGPMIQSYSAIKGRFGYNFSNPIPFTVNCIVIQYNVRFIFYKLSVSSVKIASGLYLFWCLCCAMKTLTPVRCNPRRPVKSQHDTVYQAWEWEVQHALWLKRLPKAAQREPLQVNQEGKLEGGS